MPLVNPPPWIQASTGRPAAPRSGVNTLRERHSGASPPSIVGSGMRVKPVAGWGAVGAGSTVGRSPSQASVTSGARRRSAPKGALANGMPRNA